MINNSIKFFRHKKATEVISSWPFWIFFAVALGITVMIIAKIGNVSVESASIIPNELEDEMLLAARFSNSEKCIAYKADVGREHSGIISQTNFNQDNLNRCFPQGNPRNMVGYAFSLTLSKFLLPGVAGPIEPPIGPINTFNWDSSFPAAKVINEDVYIFYVSGGIGAITFGRLQIEVQNVQ